MFSDEFMADGHRKYLMGKYSKEEIQSWRKDMLKDQFNLAKRCLDEELSNIESAMSQIEFSKEAVKRLLARIEAINEES